MAIDSPQQLPCKKPTALNRTFAAMQSNNKISPELLANLNIAELNEMQHASINAAKAHEEVILLSATGSGKTLAFLLPVLNTLNSTAKTTQALIIVPSRELAIQIEKVFRDMKTGYKITSVYGGHLRQTEENNLIEPPAVLVGTPGRLADHIRRGSITLQSITTLVLDEFDKSTEFGFEEEMSFIIGQLPSVRKRILTSATDAAILPDYVGITKAVKLDFLKDATPSPDKLAIKAVFSPDEDKSETLFQLLCHLGPGNAIVFCNFRESVERTANMLTNKGIPNEVYHGSMEQFERERALARFRNGTVNILVTTDLGSRGLDIPGIQTIIHYHLPGAEDIYTHRNGRTARMYEHGTAILMLSPGEYMPPYISPEPATIELPGDDHLPPMPKWATLFFSAGKKDKINKIDIVGFLGAKAKLNKDEIGLIDVKDYTTYVAIPRTKAKPVLDMIRNEKIKNKTVKMELTR